MKTKSAEKSVVEEVACNVLGAVLTVALAFLCFKANSTGGVPSGQRLGFGDHARLARTLFFD